MGKPLILVTNDDGITAPGLRTLIKIMNQIESIDINSSFDYKIAKYFSKKIIYKN